MNSWGVIKPNSIIIPNDGDIGSAGANDAIQIDSNGIVTFKDDIKIKDGGTIGTATTDDAMTVASNGIVTFKDDILVKKPTDMIIKNSKGEEVTNTKPRAACYCTHCSHD